MATIRPIIQDLELMFKKANDRFFDGELPKPVITIIPDGGRSYGWFTPWKAWSESEQGYYEINISAEYLNLPIEQVIATMLHEMVHLYNHENGIKDTSRGSMYHNLKFKTESEKRGLNIEKDNKYGWTITTLNQDGLDFVNSLEQKDFALHRVNVNPTEESETKPKKKSSSRKYKCPMCDQSVRATKEIKLLCGECSSEDNLVVMELEE